VVAVLRRVRPRVPCRALDWLYQLAIVAIVMISVKVDRL
jgi:hypothetical protein